MSGSASSSDGSGNTPVQAGIPAPPTPSATLLSLPNELIASVGRHVAPLGGRKAGVLRLVCRRLDGVLAPLAWSSITFPPEMTDLDPLLVCTGRNQGGKTFPVWVLESLPNLTRLHIVGTPDQVNPELGHWKMGKHLKGALASMPALSTLVLENVELMDDSQALASWAPTVRSLVIKRCPDGNVLFQEGLNGLAPISLVTLDYTVSEDGDAVWQSTKVAEAILACQQTVRSVKLYWERAEDDATNIRMPDTWPSGPDAVPVDLHITGLSDLFSPPTATSNFVTTTFVVRLLNWIGKGHLTSLTLPLHHTFRANDTFSKLALPHLETLFLFNVYPPLIPLVRDVLDSPSCTNLLSFIENISTPSLKKLHLRGWFDHSGVLSVATIAQVTPHQLALVNVHLVGLLQYLRGGAVVEVVLENSEGHVEGDVRCVFRRQGITDWVATLVRFW